MTNEYDEALGATPPEDYHEREFWRWASMHYQTIRTALTQAAEIARGDKVVVPREPNEEIITRMVQEWTDYAKASAPTLIMWSAVYKAMIQAAENNDE